MYFDSAVLLYYRIWTLELIVMVEEVLNTKVVMSVLLLLLFCWYICVSGLDKNKMQPALVGSLFRDLYGVN